MAEYAYEDEQYLDNEVMQQQQEFTETELMKQQQEFTEQDVDDMIVRNIQPRGRLARRKDRESVEKKMLRSRNSGFERHGPHVEAPFYTEPDSALYLDDTDRFVGTAVDDLRQARDKERQEGLNRGYTTRLQRLDRDAQRWENMEQKALDEQVKYNTWRAKGTHGKKNVSSVSFNVLTNNVSGGAQGRVLKQHDVDVLARGEQRARNLYKNGNSKYNLFTGEEQKPIFAPIRVYNVTSRPSSTY